MPKSKHEYRDPAGNVLVQVGDELTPDVIVALAKAHAVRVPNTSSTTTAIVEVEEPPGPDTDELVTMIENAQQQIAEATATLREVCNLTNDLQRGAVMVAHLEALVSTGGWCALESETLDGWIKELSANVPA